ncbi:hypothetical protein PFBG_03024 [Plasmodium falciparum 7G8]|uniref:Uncharacterized protein n=1 Tax=Plasmodium falciparum (isolate 7G8) TaxID=57266 RepID=W7FL04_PLAF8|nr:hypothetical protein PFBG_03024 [Plasmodium falciparum 7G8]
MFKKRLNKNVFSIFKKYNSSYICFDENKQNLKKFCNIKNIELRKNVHTNKTEIFIDDKILLTNRKNVFSLKNEDLCLLIKLEILRNKNNMDVLKTPITLCVNNLIDFVNLKEHNMLPKNYDHKYNNKGDNKYNNKGEIVNTTNVIVNTTNVIVNIITKVTINIITKIIVNTTKVTILTIIII